MPELRFERTLSTDARTAWRWLTDPEHMNRWSEARVRATSDGPPDVAGATREVTVPAFGMRSRLQEVIVEADPPRRFVYRVVSGGALRDHRGTITLSGDDPVELTWAVRFDAPPGLGALLTWVLRPRLARSLDDLARQLASAG